MKKDTINYSNTAVITAVNQVIPIRLKHNGVLTVIQLISVTDQDNNPTRIDIGYQRSGVFVPLKSFATPGINFTVALEAEVWMFSDDIPAVRITGGVVGDHLQTNFLGYVLHNNTMGD